MISHAIWMLVALGYGAIGYALGRFEARPARCERTVPVPVPRCELGIVGCEMRKAHWLDSWMERAEREARRG